MIVTIDAETTAIELAMKKVEKKYKDLGIEYIVNNYDEFSSFNYTEKAQVDYEKYLKYFYDILTKNNKHYEQSTKTQPDI